MWGSSVESVTSELWQPGPLPVVPEAMRIVPARTAAASNSRSSRLAVTFGSCAVWAVGQRIDAREHGVERDLLQHEPAVVAAVIDVVQIPLAEVVVRAFARRVVEVVGARIERQALRRAADRTRLVGEFPDRSR